MERKVASGPDDATPALADRSRLRLNGSAKRFVGSPHFRPLSAAVCLWLASSLLARAQVTVSNPSDGAIFTNAGLVSIQATVTTNVTAVDFYQGGEEKGIVNLRVKGTFTYDWLVTRAENGSNQWTAVAIDPFGGNTWTSAVVNVTVQIPPALPPAIFLQPGSQKVVEGRIAFFRVGADGAPPLAYQWFLNGNPLSDATEPTLKLVGVNTNLAGDFSVTISNPYGAVTSGPAMLQLVQPTLSAPTSFRLGK